MVDKHQKTQGCLTTVLGIDSVIMLKDTECSHETYFLKWIYSFMDKQA